MRTQYIVFICLYLVLAGNAAPVGTIPIAAEFKSNDFRRFRLRQLIQPFHVIDVAKQIGQTLEAPALDKGIDASPFAQSQYDLLRISRLQKDVTGKASDVDAPRFGKGRDQDSVSSSALKAFDPSRLGKIHVVMKTNHFVPGDEGRLLVQLEKMERLGTLDSFNAQKGEYVEKHFSGQPLSEFLSPRPRVHSDSDVSVASSGPSTSLSEVSVGSKSSSLASGPVDLLKIQTSAQKAFSEELIHMGSFFQTASQKSESLSRVWTILLSSLQLVKTIKGM